MNTMKSIKSDDHTSKHTDRMFEGRQKQCGFPGSVYFLNVCVSECVASVFMFLLFDSLV